MVRQSIEVTTFAACNSGMSNTPLKAEGQFTARNSVMIVVTRRCSPRVTASVIIPLGTTWSRLNLYQGEVVGLKSVNKAVGYFFHYNQGIFVRMVHLICFCFGEEDVFWFQCYAPWGTYARGVHRGLRSCFLSILVASMMTFSGLARSAKYGVDLPFYG